MRLGQSINEPKRDKHKRLQDNKKPAYAGFLILIFMYL